MDYVKINNTVYDVLVTEITETFEIRYSANTGSTLATGARMVLDPIGTFYGHSVTFMRKKGHETEYDALYDLVSQPTYDGIPVEIVHGQTVLAYDAYVSTGERTLKRIDETR